jgi:hypothetical protein
MSRDESTSRPSLLDRWRGLSRALQWAILAALALVAYLGVVEPVIDLTNSYASRATLAAEELKTLSAQAERRADAATTVQIAARSFGEVYAPDREGDPVGAARQRISAVLAEQGVDRFRLISPAPTDLDRGAMEGFVDDPETQQVQKVTISLDLTSTPERVLSVIADLERAPEITLIADVSLRAVTTRDARLVRATLTPEVWVVTRRRTR